MTERAVSHMVGFILIFGIIMTGATFALVVGQGGISDIAENEQTVNAEHQMVLVGQGLNGLDQSRSASTVGTLNLNDGSIRATSAENVTVTVANDSTGVEWTGQELRTGSLAYELDDTVIRYENGMVLRSDSGNGIEITEPSMTCTDDRVVVSVITLNRSGSQQIGSGRANVVAYQNDTQLLYPRNRTGVGSAVNATDVFVEVNSTHDDVWRDSLLGNQNWNWSSAGDEYRCDVGPDGQVYVRRTVIDVRFER